MATTDYEAARRLQAVLPHTYTAMEHLAMAMEKAYRNRGKTSFFGHDKGLKSYVKFEEKLRDTLLALVMDGVLDRFSSAEEFRMEFGAVLYNWAQTFPNWPDAYAFATKELVIDEESAKRLINSLIGAPL